MKVLKPLTLVILACMISKSVYASDVTHLKVSRIGDTELNCGQLSQESVLMRDIVSTTEGIKEGSEKRNLGISAAGAVGSFLVSSVTGGIGIAAAGYLLQQNSEDKMDEADSVQDIAEQRRSLMMGIYNAKGCFGPLEHAYNHFEFEVIGSNTRSNQTEVASIQHSSGDHSITDHKSNRRYNN